MLKCLVCGATFPEGTTKCPVCGVGPEQFVTVEEKKVAFTSDDKEMVVIVGGGIAAVSAAQAVRERNAAAGIVLLTEEDVLPYNRPMLTKDTSLSEEALAIHPSSWYEERNIVVAKGMKVVSADMQEKTVTTQGGAVFAFTKLILATGASCFIPPFPGAQREGVLSIRTVKDVEELRRKLPAKNAVVIGGGVLGLEAAWSLRQSGCEVTVLETSDRLMSRQLHPFASHALMAAAENSGVHIATQAVTAEIEGDSRVTGVRLEDGTLLPAQVVVISTGVRANVALAQQMGLTVDRGIVVDDRMRTSLENVYACGDCAQYNGLNMAVWPEAASQGEVAGANAAGDNIAYKQEPIGMSFHGFGSGLYALGDNGSNPDITYEEKRSFDPMTIRLEQFFYVDGKRKGATLLGDISKMAEISLE